MVEAIFNKLSLVRDDILSLFSRYAERGLTVEELEAKSEDLAESSHLFVIPILPWYRRCCWLPPAWWFRLSGSNK